MIVECIYPHNKYLDLYVDVVDWAHIPTDYAARVILLKDMTFINLQRLPSQGIKFSKAKKLILAPTQGPSLSDDKFQFSLHHNYSFILCNNSKLWTPLFNQLSCHHFFQD